MSPKPYTTTLAATFFAYLVIERAKILDYKSKEMAATPGAAAIFITLCQLHTWPVSASNFPNVFIPPAWRCFNSSRQWLKLHPNTSIMRLTFFLFALLPALAMGQFAHQDGSHITIVPDLTESQEPGLRYRLACSDAALYFTPVPVQIQIKVVPEATEGQNQLELEPVTFGTMLLHDRRSSMFMDLPAMPAGHYFLVCWADNYVPSWYHFVVE